MWINYKLSLELYQSLQLNISNGEVQNVYRIFSKQLSIIKIKQKFKLMGKYSFQFVSVAAVIKFVKDLALDKATDVEIPVNALKIVKLVSLLN